MANKGQNTLMGILCYLGVLVIIPLIVGVKDSFTREHMKQGLMLLLVSVVAGGLRWVPMGGFVAWIVHVAVFVASIVGIVKVLQGESWTVPLVGEYAKGWKL